MHKKETDRKKEEEIKSKKEKLAMSDPSSTDVFETGKYQVKTITVRKSHTTRPPVELFIVAPLQKGKYPLLLFCHGFMLTNTWYTTLLQYIASHGYIVIAPNLYGLIPVSIPEEVKRAARVVEWLPTGLPLVLPENVTGDADNLALSGHSRGGKAAFALALGRLDDKNSRKKNKKAVTDNTPPPPNPYKVKAVIGIDPVGGSSPSSRPPPNILEYIPRCFNMSIPVAVIGTGYGNQSKGLFPPFAPDGVNHSEFYNESRPPACYFLTRDYGHVDMMDDCVVDIMKYICKSGKGSKDYMRRSVGGIVVAFLRCYLDKVEEDLNAIVDDPTLAPILLDPVIYVKE